MGIDLKYIICERPDGSKIGYDQFEQLMYVRPQKYSDGSLSGHTVGSMVADARNMTCGICGKGWEATVDSMIDSSVDYRRKTAFHLTCLNGHFTKAQHDLFCDIMVSTNRPFQMKEIPNGYWSTPFHVEHNPVSTPWYEITVLRKAEEDEQPIDDFHNVLTPFKIIVGRRKRVYEAELICSDPKIKLKPTSVLEQIEHTKSFSKDKIMTHSWTKEELESVFREYSRVMEAAGFEADYELRPTTNELLREEVARLKEALSKYGAHEPNCPKEAMPMLDDSKCTCGYANATK